MNVCPPLLSYEGTENSYDCSLANVKLRWWWELPYLLTYRFQGNSYEPDDRQSAAALTTHSRHHTIYLHKFFSALDTQPRHPCTCLDSVATTVLDLQSTTIVSETRY